MKKVLALFLATLFIFSCTSVLISAETLDQSKALTTDEITDETTNNDETQTESGE